MSPNVNAVRSGSSGGLVLAALAAALLTTPAVAERASESALRDLCPDRPGKGTSPCTVDKGHFQIEVDLFDQTRQHQNGITTSTEIAASPTLKYGAWDDLDIEIGLEPYVRAHSHDATSGTTQTDDGVGDIFLRAKYVPAWMAAGGITAGLEPFAKLPTANRRIGNGAVEGGLLAPLNLDLGSGWSLSSTPEIDVLKNSDDDGRHATFVDVIGVSRALPHGLGLSAELWESTNFDPSGKTQQYSADIAASWQPDGYKSLQLDGGVNFGLNRATPDIQIYLGTSYRF